MEDNLDKNTYIINPDNYDDEYIIQETGFTFAHETVSASDINDYMLPDIPIDDIACLIKMVSMINPLSLEIVDTKFFIKMGGNGGFFYDPWSIYNKGNARDYVSIKGQDTWIFTEVKQKVFILYTNFLKTRNKSWLLNAERENLNNN